MAALTIQEGVTQTSGLNSNARSEVLRLNPGENRIWIYSASWDGTKAAALKYAPLPDDVSLGEAKDVNGAVSLTANGGVDMNGPGFVCFDLTGADGEEVFMAVLQCATM